MEEQQVFTQAGCSRIWSAQKLFLDRIPQHANSKHLPICREHIPATSVSLLPLCTDGKGRTHAQSQGLASDSEGRIQAGFFLKGFLGGIYRGHHFSKPTGVSYSWVSKEDCASHVTLHIISFLSLMQNSGPPCIHFQPFFLL